MVRRVNVNRKGSNMETKPPTNWETSIASLILAVIVAVMGLGAALATKPQPSVDASAPGDAIGARGPGTADAGIAADAKPDDIQVYY
jgi:hypothetical protein